MRNSHILIFTLLVLSAFSQSVSLTSFLKGSKSSLPPNCSEQDQQNVCTKCSLNYDLQNGSCVQKNEEKIGSTNVQVIPCGKQESCGEAKNFKNEKDFEDFINKNAPKQQIGFLNDVVQLRNQMPVAMELQTVRVAQPMMMAAESTVAGKAAPLPSVDANRDFSGTNNQVNGVDEADLLKTDGTYIYTISNSILSIILAYPANKARVVSQISLTDFTPSAIFIEGDYLAVFGTQWQYFGYDNTLQFAKIYRPYGYSISYTFIKIYDVSNRGKPYLLKEFQVSGNYFNGRKLENGFMYLITTHDFYNIRRPWFDFGSGRRDVSTSSIFWYPGIYQHVSAVNIISFNLANPIRSTKKVVTICAEYTNIMYMSERNIYLTNYHYENGQEYTKIRKIYVRGSYIRPFADGKVRGSVNNQFSLDEYGQFLRIATTSNDQGTTSNNIFVLDYLLQPYGQLTGIAKGERIFSVRYTERLCMIVTFRQVDPFFTITLKNHRKPQILGELKVPGFSRYLHIYDDDTVIGLGRQADANGRQLGLKISVFDISDVFNPKESAKFELEQKYASSTAEWEHKAFLFSADKNLLVIPGFMDFNGVKFNGAFAFYISKTEITLRSAIDHILNSEDNFYERNVERSLYIEELLYTKSKCLLRINKISQFFEGVKNINIPCQNIVPKIPVIKPIPLPRPIPIPRPRPLPLEPFQPIQAINIELAQTQAP